MRVASPPKYQRITGPIPKNESEEGSSQEDTLKEDEDMCEEGRLTNTDGAKRLTGMYMREFHGKAQNRKNPQNKKFSNLEKQPKHYQINRSSLQNFSRKETTPGQTCSKIYFIVKHTINVESIRYMMTRQNFPTI